MIGLRLAEIASIVGGRLEGDDVEVGGEAFLDSRSPVTGGLFVAFAGERVDGHDFAAAALAGGAAGVLGSRPVEGPTVVVDDVQRALGDLAREVLARRRAAGGLTVVALTGSQGKTSTKDLLARVLADAGPTVATYGSFNNEIGFPLTVLRVTDQTRFLVLEMGARGIGHLARLCAIARPDISVVLNVGRAHIGEFGSQDAIAQAKGELVEALDATGTAVLNADDPRVRAMASRSAGHVLTFGTAEDADVRFGDLHLDELGRARFVLTHGARHEEVALRLLGEHHATNAAAAATAALAAGLSLADVAASLRAVESLSKWRMQLLERADGLRVVNDAYNANPDSMRAALQTLAAIGRSTGARTVAVLGEMLELGDSAEVEHRAVGALVAELGIDRLVVVGEGAAAIADGAAAMSRTPLRTRDVHEATRIVGETVQAPDVVLVKASRGAALERVAEALMEGEA
ncbi:UDP-N-acetylmuramoyl-tripeptide--D-alanyl-D-alanine ligase [Nocardioides mangrovicus]|uniref:UDP-N-acetylmuramoyl-tripeptide--D-alanyl-D-alanine ligase n=1 Tax=Nocardioides mangrovicus TaxID=2478913 RepID=A0A3L8P310_9ACTN|nr:UDP-N-acetylmuramoyl-tripeptide--D-alanyl-D-alanine ligase [Nocardioides mangrovicus]RLV48959.1 UDP-N-acetylmuramoyl-tripeptide--D-alanyl-D-alanine ligase [Nocardioides mangrovicus]